MLPNNKLRGTFPAEIGALAATLMQLDISSNFLVGRLPRELAAFTELRALMVQENQLEGPFPEIWNAPLLEFVDLSYNLFSVPIPKELSLLTKLNILLLAGMGLTGSVADIQFGDILVNIDLSWNQLEGPLPNLTLANTVQHLQLNNNRFNGSIPTDYAKPGLVTLLLGNNRLTGAIPAEFANLTKLATIDLSNNQLEGSLPPGLGTLAALKSLILHDNRLQGAVPPEIGQLSCDLNLAKNNFTSVPYLAANTVNISFNALTILNSSFNGSSFDASYNPISVVTNEFWSAPNVLTVALEYAALSNLTTFAPFSAVNSTQLRHLYLSGSNITHFSSFLKAFPAAVANLESLALRRTNLIDPDPSDWGSTTLRYLDLGDNPLFSPPLQSACYSSPHLLTLRVDRTKVDFVPFNCMTQLEHLDLSYATPGTTGIELCAFLPYLSSLYVYGLQYNNPIIEAQEIIRDDSNQASVYPELHLSCPSRVTHSGGLVHADPWFLEYRNCTCSAGLFWNGQECNPCPPNLHCDLSVRAPSHRIMGNFYPLIDGHLASPRRYPVAQLVPCAIITACNPGDGLVCGAGRDQESRACAKCLPGWFDLDRACFECNTATPYLVLVFLPLTMLCFALYAWKRSTRYPAQQGAGVSICIFGLQLLTVSERFYHQYSLSAPTRDLPDILEVFRQSVNFRFWGFDCWNASVDFKIYFCIRAFFLLLVLLYLVVSHFAKWRQHPQLKYVMCFFLDMAYFPSCVAILELFVCDSDSYLSIAPYFSCTEGAALQALAGICLLCYGLGMPLWFSYVVWSNRTNLASGELDHLRFLIDSLDDTDARTVAWPLWRFSCRLFLALLTTQILRQEMWPALSLLMILVFLTAVQTKLSPHQNRLDNALELLVLVGSGILFLVCVLEAKDSELYWLRVVLYYVVLLAFFCGLVGSVVVSSKKRQSQNENSLLLNTPSKSAWGRG